MSIFSILYSYYNPQNSLKSPYVIDFYRPTTWVICLSFRMFFYFISLLLFPSFTNNFLSLRFKRCFTMFSFVPLRLCISFNIVQLFFVSFFFVPIFLVCSFILLTQTAAGQWLQRRDPRHCVAYVSKFDCTMDRLTF